MSARRVTPKASTLPAKNGRSRLDHVLSVGMSNLSINKPAVVPEKATKFSFANAHKAVLRKTKGADIGVLWACFSVGQEEEMVQKQMNEINYLLGILPNINGQRNKIHSLSNDIILLGNPDNLASSSSVNRTYYVYLLQVLASALRSTSHQDSKDSKFAKDWPTVIKGSVDKATTTLARGVLDDPTISPTVKNEVLQYFNHVNRHIFNYFTEGDIMAGAASTSPLLTAYMKKHAEPSEDVRESSAILRDLQQSSAPLPPTPSPEPP